MHLEGILILLLVVWAVVQAGKKPKTKSKPSKENAETHRTERLAQMRAELEKRKALLTKEEEEVQPSSVKEGETAAGYLRTETAFRGSMTMESTEGECFCDPELEHARQMDSDPKSVYAGEIGKEPLVDLSQHGIVQGIVMSEILARPAQRARRY